MTNKLAFNIEAAVIENNLKYKPEKDSERQYLMSTFCSDLSNLVRKYDINCSFTSQQPLYVKKQHSQKTESPYLQRTLNCSFKNKGQLFVTIFISKFCIISKSFLLYNLIHEFRGKMYYDI